MSYTTKNKSQADIAMDLVQVAKYLCNDQDVIEILSLAQSLLYRFCNTKLLDAPVKDEDFSEEALFYIRKLIGFMLEAQPCSEYALMWLSIINGCQSKLGKPSYKDIDTFLHSDSLA